jgi:hypothetical protein
MASAAPKYYARAWLAIDYQPPHHAGVAANMVFPRLHQHHFNFFCTTATVALTLFQNYKTTTAQLLDITTKIVVVEGPALDTTVHPF